jgi:ADP-ribose pyrophosphatase YjhB (NUDIX family)
MQDMALEMLALAANLPAEELEPLRGTLFVRPTPLVTGDAAIFDDQNRLLLIQRADNGKWAFPGGALAVGETPAEGTLREALEETGLACEALALVAVHDSRLCGTISPFHLYQFTFLCRPLAGIAPRPPSHANETLGQGWFAEDELPPADSIDPGHITRIPLAFQARSAAGPAYFDKFSGPDLH